MEKEVIHVDKKYTYLNQFMTELPINCLFDKGKTGCGGTTIAIENNRHTIIVMPYVNLIKNKESQYPNERTSNKLLGIYDGVTKEKIIEYLDTNKIWKIAVTYDSLERLILILEDKDIDVYKEFYLLIDEYHILFNSYCFRNPAIKQVLKYSPKFEEFTFMTATPIEKEFQLKELKDLPIVEAKWKNTVPIKIIPEVTNNTEKRVYHLIIDKLEDKIFGNLHFFVNSVEFISNVIKRLKLDPKNVKVVCSDDKGQGRGKKSNQAKLGDYKIEQPLDPVKKINFYTSTCFEGCDLYDEEGRTYIVSDKYKSHTLLDISTLIIQICGRIRNSKYITDVTHIFSETRYSSNVSFEDYKEETNIKKEKAIQLVHKLNLNDDDCREIIINAFVKSKYEGINELYITNNNNYFEFDENLINVDIVNYKITHQVYESRITLKDEYESQNFKVQDAKEFSYATDKLKANSNAKISFKDLFEEYATIREEQPIHFHFGNPQDRRTLIEEEKPLIKQAYDKLGVDKVRELKYNSTNIKREIYKRQSDISIDRKIIKALSDIGIRQGVTKTAEEFKIILQGIYEGLEIIDSRNKIKKAKATDLDRWFEIKPTTPKINGKTKNCYTIIMSKIIFK